MKKQMIFGLIMVFVVVSMLGVVSAEMLVSDEGVEYNSRILDEFDKLKANESTNDTFVPMFMELKDISEAGGVISIFDEDEFKLLRVSSISTKVVGEITEEGFYKLIQDDRVDVVHYNTPVVGHDPEPEVADEHGMLVSDSGVEYEFRIIEEFEKLKINETTDGNFVDIQIFLKDKSEADNLFSSFSEDEVFDVLNRPISEVIGARVTEEGFYKLIQDDRVDRVYYNRPLYFELDSDNKIKWLGIGAGLLILIVVIYIIVKKATKRKKK